MEHVTLNNPILVADESNAVLNADLNTVLGLLNGYRFHHRHQGETDRHPAAARAPQMGSEISPSPSAGAGGDVTDPKSTQGFSNKGQRKTP